MLALPRLMTEANPLAALLGVGTLGLAELTWPTFTSDQVTTIVLDALVLAVPGSIDTLRTAVIADSLTRSEHDANRELVGQGIGNLAAGMFGGLPGAGATMGTVVNIHSGNSGHSGARAALSGLVRALVLMVVVTATATVTQHVPLTVLAGIAIKVGIDILDWSFLSRAHRTSCATALTMYGVLALTVFVDLIVAVGAGVFLANLLIIEAVLLFHLSGPMIFGVTRAIARQHATVVDKDAMVLDLGSASMLDTSVALTLENTVRDTLDAGCAVFIVVSDRELRGQLQSVGVTRLVRADDVLSDRLAALRPVAAGPSRYQPV